MRWPWTRPLEVRESYTNIIETALHDAALGSIGKPQPQETSAVLAGCRLWSRCHLFVRRVARRSATRCTALDRVAAR